ncbi:MAG TPA: MaoC/PaaZ C-terminal domain-containing protein [Xanthobacteraceae bacterium]|jgi:acyl dehydratase
MPLDYQRIMAYRPADMPIDYGPRDCIIYALGIGIGMDPMDWGQLKFVYEKGLAAFPSMAVVLGRHGPLLKPEFGVDQRMMVAAALKIVLHEPLAVAAKLTARPRVREVIDKGTNSAAIIEMTRDLLAPDGRVVATVDNSTLVRKHGGFGGKVREIAPPHEVPTRTPDAVVDLPTPGNLALVYRLTGDENPLHSDPDRARSVGFPRPILHGAATFGIASHAVVRHIGYRSEDLGAVEARFVRPVYPGDTLRTELWREGNRLSFQCSAAGRDGLVLTNGLATLRS